MASPVRIVSMVVALMVGALAPAFAAPAAAADVADEAQFHFVRGNQFYRQGRFDDALTAYYASNRLVANRNVQFNIARCLEQLKLYDEAFRLWSALDTPNQVDAERATIKAAIDRLRPHLALVSVTTEPPGAVIYVGRRDLGALGSTPKLLALPEGKVTLVLDREGYRAVEVVVDVGKAKEARATAVLERIYGHIELRRLPAISDVRRDFVDGEVVHHGPGAVRLVPGRHVLFVSAAGFQTERVEVEVQPDAVVPIDVPLVPAAPPTGALVVRANIDGALVRIDGREMGFTPAVVEGVLEGERAVEISREGRQTFRAVVSVKKGERAYLEVRLRRAEPEITAATKSLVRAEDAPASIEVVTADEIAAFGWTTLGEALAGVRGAFASNDRSYESVGFRGFSPPGDYTNRVLVLVDGHPYNEITVGQGFVGHELDVDLSNVERIEVVRGPGSVLYGTAALFGVINVVSKRPVRGPHGSALVQSGSLGLLSGRATLSARGEASEITIGGASLRQIGDRQYRLLDGATSVRRGDVERAHHADATARVGPLTLRAGWNQRDKDVPTGAYETRAEPGTNYLDTRAYAELRGDTSLGAFKLSGRAAYDMSRFRGTYKLTPDDAGKPRDDLADRFAAQWVTGELRLELPVLAGQRVTVGGETQSQFQIDLGSPSSAAQVKAGGDSELVLSGYVVDDWRMTGWLRVNLGVRADQYRHSFGSTLNPRLAVIAQPYRGGNTKLLLGRAFRAPSAYERFYNDGGATQVQAVSLSPETILSAEIEHVHTLEEDVALVGTVFANQVDHLIELGATTISGTSEALVYKNRADRVRSLGAEAELRWEPGAATLLVFSYSWQRVRALDANGVERPFANAPAHLVSVRGLYALVPTFLRLGNELLYDAGRHSRAGERVDDAVMWNVTVSGEYRAWRLRYFAGLFNLLDVRGYGAGFPVGEEVLSPTVPRYGRSARVGLAAAF